LPGRNTPPLYPQAAPAPYDPPRPSAAGPEYDAQSTSPVTHAPNPLFPDEAAADPYRSAPPEAIPTNPMGVEQQPTNPIGETAQDFAISKPEGELEPLDDAPTRVEREEDIRASFESIPQQVPHLLIIGGNNRGREYTLKLGDNSIGRGVDNDIILADIAVSRKHTLVCYEGNQFVVRDLGSGNGTLLNGNRVASNPLQDGDQLELGNTLLRFVSPMSTVVDPQEEDPAALASMATVVNVQQPTLSDTDGARVTADIKPVVAPVETQQEQRGKAGRTKKLLIFGSIGVVVLLGALTGVKLMLDSKKKEQLQRQQRQTPPPDELAAQEFQEGIAQYRIRNWEKARVHFLKVIKLVPTADHAKRYVDQSTAELEARDALERAKNSLAAKDFPQARRELVKIPSTSAYAADAHKVKQKIDDEQLSKLLVEVRSLKAADDKAGARAKLKEALKLAPTNAAVLKLSADLSGDKRIAVKTTPRTPRTQRPRHKRSQPTPRRPRNRPPRPAQQSPGIRVGGKQKAVIALYKKKQWGAAYKEAKTYAQGQRGRAKRNADKLAEAIRRVGQSWTRADAARTDAARLKYYNNALKNDRKIKRGMHQAKLKQLVIAAAKGTAARAIAQRRYTTAAKAVKIAEGLGARDATLEKAKKTLDQKAMELFTKGYTMRTTNVAQARRLWQQVLKMVPPSSQAYQKAYTWLNNSSPTYQDEDED
jgi:pSer/pThr/pTyr-binding forkhead associated (FHA) protein